MKLSVYSDGTSMGTRVVNAETGEMVEDIRSIKVEVEVGGRATLTLVVYGAKIHFDLQTPDYKEEIERGEREDPRGT